MTSTTNPIKISNFDNKDPYTHFQCPVDSSVPDYKIKHMQKFQYHLFDIVKPVKLKVHHYRWMNLSSISLYSYTKKATKVSKLNSLHNSLMQVNEATDPNTFVGAKLCLLIKRKNSEMCICPAFINGICQVLKTIKLPDHCINEIYRLRKLSYEQLQSALYDLADENTDTACFENSMLQVHQAAHSHVIISFDVSQKFAHYFVQLSMQLAAIHKK